MSCHTAQTVAGSPASLPDLRGCASSLDDSGGVCCTSSKLDDIHSSVLTTQSSSTPSCYTAFARVQCGVACDQTFAQWWDASRQRAHLCSELCQDLWTYCYSTSGWTPPGGTAADKITDEASFCDYHSGPNRADTSACLGYLEGTRPAGTSFIGAAGLLAPKPPPSPPRPPMPPYAPPRPGGGEDAATGGRIGVSIMLLFLFGLSVWYYRRWKRRNAILGPAASAGATTKAWPCITPSR